MTLEELANHFGWSATQMRWRMYHVAKQIGQDAVQTVKAKLGVGFGGAGPFPEWEELSPHTLYEKALYGYATPSPLYREGDLAGSIGFSAINTSSRGIVVNLFSTSPYAPTQELGGGPSNVPPRAFLGPVPFERGDIYSKMVGQALTMAIMPNGPLVSLSMGL